MSHHRLVPALCCLLAVLAARPAAAGSVQVSFAPTDRFTDAGDRGRQSTDNLLTLSLHLQRLGERVLRDGQSLAIEVLDVDLAGRNRPFSRSGSDIRFVTGRTDWPRITLRWTLRGGDQVLGSAEETVSDLNYLAHNARLGSTDPLGYEKAMLDRWFKSRFGATARPS